MTFFHRDHTVQHVGCLPPRSYFIPFPPGTDPAGNRSASPFFTSLCGEWQFAWFPDAESLNWDAPGFPACVPCPEKTTVPGCWQLHTDRGYDPPNYINQDYPFPVDPPYLPEEIPGGLYRKSLCLTPEADKRFTLVFEGVSSCFYLWVNGAFIGYSEVSHCVSEFDVTDALTEGENVFEIFVLKHCTGSYMEDQDFFRLSGIFREVYLLTRPAAMIRDVEIRSLAEPGAGIAALRVSVKTDGAPTLRCRLLDPDGGPVREATGRNEFVFQIDSPLLWSAETPALYGVALETETETVFFPVGIRDVRICDKKLLFNGAPIKLRGVNRHDMSPETGYAVTEDHMLRDLYLLKRANVNCIRTSHYPNDPRFLRMCDELGFYVIDEADLESHGMGYNYGDWDWSYWAFLCDSPEWADACTDRAARLYERDKNHPCVLFWSLGNESGCGENHRKMARYIRQRDPAALIHYENAHLEYAARVGRDFSDISDVESRMYASLDYLREYLNDPANTKPFFYCEYVSATSTGDIPLHWDEFEAYENYCGGCIWEFADHAVNVGTKDRPRYRYGGDFGDDPNDGISCLDGLVFPDRTPRPGYYDMKDAYKPFAVSFENGSLTIRNRFYFRKLDGCCLCWEFQRNGETVTAGERIPLAVPPRGAVTLNLPVPVAAHGFETLIVRVLTTEQTVWAAPGHEIGHAQFILHDAPVSLPVPITEPTPLRMEETRESITVRAGSFSAVVNKRKGTIDSIRTDRELLSAPVDFSIFKSYLYFNPSAKSWERARYDRAIRKNYQTEVVSVTDGEIRVRVGFSFAAAAMPPALKGYADLSFFADGRIGVSAKVTAAEKAPCLPRFGLLIPLTPDFEEAEYLGFGPQEAYPDRLRSQTLEPHKTTATENFVHYARPTENGAHCRTKTAMIRAADGTVLRFADLSAGGFVFNVKHYADRQLHETAHDDELTPLPQTIVSLDYKTHAENPSHAQLEPDRLFDEKDFAFSWEIQIENKNLK